MDSLPVNLGVCGQVASAEGTAGRRAEEDLISPPLDSYGDITLINLFRTGSEHARDAMGILFNRYRRLVLSVSLKILRDRAEAEDLVQDVFIEICKKVHLFDEKRGSVKMWILQYAYSRSLNRRSYLALRQANEPLSDPSNGNGYHISPELIQLPGVLEDLTLEERGNTIRNALKALPEKQKRVIELVYFEGLLIKEIPELIGENFGNVRNLYYRGLKKLQQSLNGGGDAKGK
jgi:RNA polymerase sigma-70 factor (ECF subfamily)